MPHVAIFLFFKLNLIESSLKYINLGWRLLFGLIIWHASRIGENVVPIHACNKRLNAQRLRKLQLNCPPC